jgi:hypothetical protein
MRCGRKDSHRKVGLKSEQLENLCLYIPGKGRALIQDHFTEGFTPKKHANKQMDVKEE